MQKIRASGVSFTQKPPWHTTCGTHRPVHEKSMARGFPGTSSKALPALRLGALALQASPQVKRPAGMSF
jgi:hypothetical protein